MLTPLRRRKAPALLVIALASSACGAKTGLLVAGHSAGRGSEIGDAGDRDAPSDAIDRGITDGSVPALGAVTPTGAGRSALCRDESRSAVYLLHEGNEVWQFFPPDAYRELGTLSCSPRVLGAHAVSIAVDRSARGLVLYDDGELFRFTAYNLSDCPDAGCSNACEPVSAWAPRTDAFRLFSMAFLSNGDSPESLLVASRGVPSALGRISIPEFSLQTIAPLPSSLAAPSLTGTGGDQLFAFYARSGGGTSVAAIDVSSGVLAGRSDLPDVALGSVGAAVVFGGEFYLFVDRDGDSEVFRFRPATGAVDDLGSLTGRIVSTAVSTCAPQ